MSSLQKIIEKMKADLLIADNGISECRDIGATENETLFIMYKAAINKYIPMLESLLNEQPEAITDDSHFRKHDVGRSAAKDEFPNKESPGESSSETQAIGQNEQTKELCPSCRSQEVYQKLIGVIKNFCISCGAEWTQ